MLFLERNNALLDRILYCLFITTVLSVPLIIDVGLTNHFIFPKEYFFLGVLLLGLALGVAKLVLAKKITIVRTKLDPMLVVIFIAGLCSAWGEPNRFTAFVGRGDNFTLSFILVAGLLGFYFFIQQVVTTKERWRQSLDAFVVVGAITAFIFITKAFGPVGKSIALWNTVDSINTNFALWLVIIFLIALGQLFNHHLNRWRTVLYALAGSVMLASLMVMDFPIVWWVLGAGLCVLVLLAVRSLKETSIRWLTVAFAVLLLAGGAALFGLPNRWQVSLPFEITLSTAPSWNLARQALLVSVKNFFLGAGPGSFLETFSQFRTEQFNYDPIIWSYRFTQPSSSFFALLSEGGLGAALPLLFLIVTVLIYLLKSWRSTQEEFSLDNLLSAHSGGLTHYSLYALAVAWFVLSAGLFFFFFSTTLWFLWWTMLGLLVAGAGILDQKIAFVWEKSSAENMPEQQVAFSFSIVLLCAGVLLAAVGVTRAYTAERAYAVGVRASSFVASKDAIEKAISNNSYVDAYHIALAQAYLLHAVQLSQAGQPTIEEVSSLLGKAVVEAKIATNLSPHSAAIWETLAVMYENAAALVPDARGWAIKSLERARELDSSNPVITSNLAKNYGLNGAWVEAEKEYAAAITLKNDYLPAYLGLANAYEQLHNSNRAIEVYASVPAAGQDNVDVLFNYGRLLYNRNTKGDRDLAEKLWLVLLIKDPNNANALYSLGLLYEGRGNKANALSFYQKVLALNPGNKIISAKLAALRSKK